MFNIGFWELILVLLVAFLVVGPKDLPKVARWLGRQVRTIRAMVSELKEETGWNEIENDVASTTEEIKQAKKDLDVTGELRSASQELQRNVNGIKKDVNKMDAEAKKNLKS